MLGSGKKFGFEALSEADERFVARRLAGLLGYQYSMGKQSLGANLIEVQLVEDLYAYLTGYLRQNGLIVPSFLSSREVYLFYDEKPEFFILQNGSLFLSESLLEEIVRVGGLEGLSYILLHELSHLIRGHLR